MSAAAGRLARLEEQLERQRLDRGLRWRLRRVVPVLGVRRGRGRVGHNVVLRAHLLKMCFIIFIFIYYLAGFSTDHVVGEDER